MNGIVINIDPVIFHLGMFELRWYSLAILLAITAAIAITVQQAKKRGIDSGQIYTLAVWVVVVGIIGARLFHVIDRWDYYGQNPGQIFQFQQGGLAIWGALVGGGAVIIIYSLLKHLPLVKLLDSLAPAMLTAHIIGRFGCIVNGDAYGGLTDLPWGFIYVHPGAMIPPELAGVPTHPYPVYEQLWNAIGLGLVLYLSRHVKKDGVLILTYLMFYSMARFFLTFVRQETITAWGLQQAQIVALVVFAVALGMMVYLLTRPARPKVAEERSSHS
ncbi:MAG: prolipoprotein diacylglyceryl transferase [Chloroflexi bacterium]|nr:prolipoprotein diacylglyceryl transferase [Chloroflexota bacterium]